MSIVIVDLSCRSHLLNDLHMLTAAQRFRGKRSDVLPTMFDQVILVLIPYDVLMNKEGWLFCLNGLIVLIDLNLLFIILYVDRLPLLINLGQMSMLILIHHDDWLVKNILDDLWALVGMMSSLLNINNIGSDDISLMRHSRLRWVGLMRWDGIADRLLMNCRKSTVTSKLGIQIRANLIESSSNHRILLRLVDCHTVNNRPSLLVVSQRLNSLPKLVFATLLPTDGHVVNLNQRIYAHHTVVPPTLETISSLRCDVTDPSQ